MRQSLAGTQTRHKANPKDLSEEFIDQALFGLMCIGLLGMALVMFRMFQFGITAILSVQFATCVLLSVSLYFRHKIPRAFLLIGIVFLLLAITAIGLLRFGLVAPALVVMTVLPVIISSVRGVKPALIVLILMVVMIAGVGIRYVTGFTQPTANLQIYMHDPVNWVMYAVLYTSMVVWGIVVTARLTDHWQASLHDLKIAEDTALREKEVVAKLQRQQIIVQLSGGVAHDFNNVLAVITTNIEFAQDLIAKQQQVNTNVDVALDDALDATTRGSDLTRSLLAFANVAELAPKELDINRFLDRSISWITRAIPENIKIETSLADDLRPILIDESALESALLNLIINARDAMSDGGCILIKTQNLRVSEDDNSPRFSQILPGDYVELSVGDTGTGISVLEQEKIFEPFYSTKGQGEGSGLAMVHGFMKQSGGAVHVVSESDGGAIFQLLFRSHDEPAKNVTSKVQTRKYTEPSGARLMIVEDEPGILNSLKMMLTASGYRVRSATSGDQAWNSLRQDSSVDLVLSDVVMPGKLQGTDLARKIQTANPELPVILMSGHTFTPGHSLNLQKVSHLLNKPIRKADLIHAIETALHGVQLDGQY